MIEFGHVLPEPGDEPVWTAALPDEDRVHAIDSHRSQRECRVELRQTWRIGGNDRFWRSGHSAKSRWPASGRVTFARIFEAQIDPDTSRRRGYAPPWAFQLPS